MWHITRTSIIFIHFETNWKKPEAVHMCLPQEIYWEEWLSWWEAASLKRGVGGGGGWRWAPKALHQISFEMRWGQLQAVLRSKEFGLHCSCLTFIFHCLNRIKTGFLGCSECFISVFHLWRILALWTEIHSLSIHWGIVQQYPLVWTVPLVP